MFSFIPTEKVIGRGGGMGEKENSVTDKNRNGIKEALFKQIKSLESVQEIMLDEMRKNQYDYSAIITEISKMILSIVKEVGHYV